MTGSWDDDNRGRGWNFPTSNSLLLPRIVTELQRSGLGRRRNAITLYEHLTRHRHFAVRLSPPSTFIIVAVVVVRHCCRHIRGTYNGIMIVMNYDRRHYRYRYYTSGLLKFSSSNFRIVYNIGRATPSSLLVTRSHHIIMIETAQTYFILFVRSVNGNRQRKCNRIIRFVNEGEGEGSEETTTNAVFSIHAVLKHTPVSIRLY